MRAFRIAIQKERTADETKFRWPAWWDRYYDKVQILGYEHGTTKGTVVEYAVGVAEDDVADAMVREGPEVQLIHPDYGDWLLSGWYPGTKDKLPRTVRRMVKEMGKALVMDGFIPQEEAAKIRADLKQRGLDAA